VFVTLSNCQSINLLFLLYFKINGMRKLFLLLTLNILVLGLAAQPPGEKEELKKQSDAIRKEIAELNKQLGQVKGTKQKSLAELRFLQDKIAARQRLINNMNREVNFIETDMTRTQREINKLNTKLDTLKQAYAKSIVYAYQNRNNSDFLTFIFASSSFNEALKRVQYLQSYREYRARQAEDIVRYKSFLQGKTKELDEKKQQKSSALQNQTVEVKELAGERNDLDATVKELTSKERNIGGIIAKMRKRQNSVSGQIAAIMKREEVARRKAADDEKKRLKALADAQKREEAARLAAERKKNNNNPATNPPPKEPEVVKTPTPRNPPKKVPNEEFALAPAEASLNADFERNRTALPWPIDKGYISMHYGTVEIGGVKFPNQSVTFETQQPGATVKTVFNGEVSAVSNDEDGTQTVFIRHGNYITVYGNLSSASVQKGQQVTTGQAIGRTAASMEGNGRGQLELMLYKGKSITNPESWLRSR
jgi:murein hydrolase activator